jgi:S-adenosylmethionine decarboxylase
LSKGSHRLVDCCEVPRRLCLDDQSILQALADAATAAGATVISQIRYRFGSDSPPGCTAIVMLDESHCSAHTYADEGLIAFDFFTCGSTDPHRIWSQVRDTLGLERASVREFARFMTPEASGTAAEEPELVAAPVGAGEDAHE